NRGTFLSGLTGVIGGSVGISGQTSLLSLGNGNSGLVMQGSNLEAGGSVTLTGQAGGGNRFNQGLLLSRASATALAGDISLSGIGHGSGNNNQGISFTRATLTASGNVTANGQGSANALGLNNSGIYGSTAVIAAGGDLSLVGVSGNGSSGNEGMRFVGGSLTATGAMTLAGTSTTNSLIGIKNNTGITFTRARLESGIGSSISGIGGAGTQNNHGILADRRTTIAGSLGIGDFVGTAGSGTGSEDLAGTFFP
ncbi:MAG: hypothetical protein KDL87_19065, partial [Verrucomicrobiae bacterium]|nr:hypothetical protein [Verrucomicrobiae bacterium]